MHSDSVQQHTNAIAISPPPPALTLSINQSVIHSLTHSLTRSLTHLFTHLIRIMTLSAPISRLAFRTHHLAPLRPASRSASHFPTSISLPRPLSSSASLRMPATDFDAAAFGEQHIAKGIGRLSAHVFEDGKGSFITTDRGVKLLDMTS